MTYSNHIVGSHHFFRSCRDSSTWLSLDMMDDFEDFTPVQIGQILFWLFIFQEIDPKTKMANYNECSNTEKIVLQKQ